MSGASTNHLQAFSARPTIAVKLKVLGKVTL
jgi:hypothetical protein